MKPDILQKAISHAQKFKPFFVVTADPEGLPHIDLTENIHIDGEDHLILRAWLSPTSLKNLAAHHKLTIVTFNSQEQGGYQLKGRVLEMQEEAMLDGYVPLQDLSVPQVEWKLFIHIEHVSEFQASRQKVLLTSA